MTLIIYQLNYTKDKNQIICGVDSIFCFSRFIYQLLVCHIKSLIDLYI